jgi:hypothetical protein
MRDVEMKVALLSPTTVASGRPAPSLGEIMRTPRRLVLTMPVPFTQILTLRLYGINAPSTLRGRHVILVGCTRYAFVMGSMVRKEELNW